MLLILLDIMAGMFVEDLCGGAQKNCPNCAPKLLGAVPYPWLTGTASNLRFGGSAIVKGTIFSYSRFAQTPGALTFTYLTVTFEEVKIENGLIFIITERFPNSSTTASFDPILFQNLVAPTNVSFTTWLKPSRNSSSCTFEYRYALL